MTRSLYLHACACVLLLAAAAGWAGCGVKSPPIPPQYARPQRIVDLHAYSEKSAIKLTWGRPVTYEGGTTMRDLGSFLVMRAHAHEPFQQIGRVEVTDSQRFQQQHVFSFLDEATTVGDTYSYEIISMTKGGDKSLPSNQATLIRSIPPPPPNPENFVMPTPAPLP